MSLILLDKIDRLRGRHTTGVVVASLSMLVLAALAALAGVILLDWLLELPYAMRLLMLAAGLTLLGLTAWRRLLRPLLSPPDDQTVALWVERRRPELRSRLVSAVEFAGDDFDASGLSIRMVRHVVAETDEIIRTIDFSDAISLVPAARWLTGAASALLVALLTLALAGSWLTPYILRALCVPDVDIPRNTRIEVLLDRQTTIARGEPLTIAAVASGVIPGAGIVRIESQDGQRTDHSLHKLGDEGRFEFTIDSVQDDLAFRVLLNDATSPLHRVRVVDRPYALRVGVRQIFPAYTGLPPIDLPPGDMSVLSGSTLAIKVTASKPVAEPRAGRPPINYIVLRGSDRQIPLRRDADDPTRLDVAEAGNTASDTGGVALDAADTGLQVVLTDGDGLSTVNPVVYPIQQTPDLPPLVRVAESAGLPRLVTRKARLPITVEAGDDYGIAVLDFRWRPAAATRPEGQPISPADDPARPWVAVEIPMAAGGRSLRLTHELDLSAAIPSLREGQRIEWLIAARDANNITGPGVGTTDVYELAIGTEAEVRAALMSRLGDYLGQINNVQQSQRDAARDLGKAIVNTPDAP